TPGGDGENDPDYRIPTLLVSGSDVVHIRVEDVDNNKITETSVRLRSQARLELLDETYSVQKETIHLGEKFSVRVTDPDQDISDERDEVEVTVAGTSGDRLTLKLTE